MPRILDNLSTGADTQMETSLLETLKTSRSLDVAVGYFNLRGWGMISDSVAALPGAAGQPKARVLVGMTEDPQAEMRRLMRAQAGCSSRRRLGRRCLRSSGRGVPRPAGGRSPHPCRRSGSPAVARPATDP